jgi:TRAP transporter TAXI family solute receptor
MEVRRLAAVAALTAATAAASAAALAVPAAADEWRMMTGPQGGVWVPLGGALKAMWEKSIPGVSIQVLPGAGISNVRAIEEGKADIGFGNSNSTVDAVRGVEPFKVAHKNVCNLATLYPQFYQVVVLASAKIETIADLKGKSITTQTKGNTGELITQHLLRTAGLSYKDVKVSFGSYTDSVAQMQDGHAQVFTLGTTIPAATVMDLAVARDIKLLDLSSSIEAMRKINPGYALVTVPKGTYAKQDADVKVIGYMTHLVVSCKLPEDKVYAMAKTVAGSVADMSAINKSMASLTPAAMATDIGVPLHPGAAKFYKDSGALK